MWKIKTPGRREKLFLLATLLAALAAAGWHFIFTPLQAAFTELRLEEASLALERDRLAQKLQQEESAAAAWPEWETRQERLHAVLPDPDRLPLVLERLEALLQQFPLEVHTLTAGELRREAQFASLEMALAVSGPAEQTLLLLERLERFTHLLIIDSARCSWHGDDTASLELTFRLIFFDP